ncbi:unnamed protein product, partial [Staurois parvus]
MYRHTYMYIHTDKCTYTQTHVHTYRDTHRYMYIHTQHYKKLQYFITFTHRARVLHTRGGREHSTHSFLCFHFAQLFSSLKAPSVSDSSEP